MASRNGITTNERLVEDMDRFELVALSSSRSQFDPLRFKLMLIALIPRPDHGTHPNGTNQGQPPHSAKRGQRQYDEDSACKMQESAWSCPVRATLDLDAELLAEA